MQEMQAFSKDKTQTNSDTNETNSVAVEKRIVMLLKQPQLKKYYSG
jgi:hypothetical protein